MKLFVNWGSADLDLVLAGWLFSKFQVRLGLDGTTLLLLWRSQLCEGWGGSGVSSNGKWHSCKRQLKCMRSFKAHAQKRHCSTSVHMSLGKVGCKAKATVKD